MAQSASNLDRLRKGFQGTLDQRELKLGIVPGLLGAVVNGVQRIKVPNRPGYAYVRLRNNPGEVIEAFNETVNFIYDMPVLLTQDPFMPKVYRIIRRDFGLYLDWPSAGSQLPRHGDQHSFGSSTGSGSDVVWVFKRQFMPLLVHPHPSESSIFDKYVQVEEDFYSWDGDYVHFTGASVDLSSLFPVSNTKSRFVLVYVNGANAVEIATGTLFDSDPWPSNETLFTLFPSIGTTEGIPLAVATLHGRETEIRWEHLYDVRSLFTGDEGKGERAIILSDLSTNRLLSYPATAAGLTSAIAASDSGDGIFIPISTISGDFEFKSGTSVVGEERFKTIINGTVTLGQSNTLQNLNIKDVINSADTAYGLIAPRNGTSLLTNCNVEATNQGAGNAVAIFGGQTQGRVALRGCYIQAQSNSGAYANVFRIETGTFNNFEAQQCTFDNNETTSKDANWDLINTGTLYLFGSNWVPTDYDPYGAYEARVGDRRREWWILRTGETTTLESHPTKVFVAITGSNLTEIYLPASPKIFDEYVVARYDGSGVTGMIDGNGNLFQNGAPQKFLPGGGTYRISWGGDYWWTH